MGSIIERTQQVRAARIQLGNHIPVKREETAAGNKKMIIVRKEILDEEKKSNSTVRVCINEKGSIVYR